jgi:hypothetical protein
LYGGGTYNRNIIVRGLERCNSRGHVIEILFLPDSEKCSWRGHIVETLFLLDSKNVTGGVHSINIIFTGFRKVL